MQRRLRRSFVGGGVALVVAFGVPLGIVTADLIHRDAVHRLQREADAVELYFRAEAAGGDVPSDALAPFLSPTSRLVVVDSTGLVWVEQGPADSGPSPLTASIHTGRGLTITVTTASAATRARQREVWLAIGALALLIVGLAWLSALVQSRRLARPMQTLADAAARLGAGDGPLELPRDAPDEVAEIARQLRISGARIGELLAREREFTANASHQLRTALTGLRLRLDELELEPATPAAAEAIAQVARQVDRLDATVEELLALARGREREGAGEFDVGAVVSERLSTWAGAYRSAGRRLDVWCGEQLRAAGDPGALRQVLDVLVDNALRHGAGTVTVTVSRRGAHPVVRVGDEGPGIPEGFESVIFERGVTGADGSGIGLALARQLVEAGGGRLVLSSARPASFEVYLAA